MTVDGQLLGEGNGKSQRSAQSKAAWHALVALGDIHLENYICLFDHTHIHFSCINKHYKGKHKQYNRFVYSSKYPKMN